MYNLLMQLIIHSQLRLQRKNADTEISKRGVHSPVGYIRGFDHLLYVVTQMMNSAPANLLAESIIKRWSWK